MRTFGSILKSAAITGFGVLGAIAFFGLLLGLIWGIQRGPTASYKLITLLIVTGLSYIAGGFFSGVLTSRKQTLYGLVFGLLLGACSFGYVLGLSPWVPLAAIAAGLPGSLGGWISERMRERKITDDD